MNSVILLSTVVATPVPLVLIVYYWLASIMFGAFLGQISRDSTNLSFYPSTIYKSIFLCIYLSTIYKPIFLSVYYLQIYLFICLLSTNLSFYLSIYLPRIEIIRT